MVTIINNDKDVSIYDITELDRLDQETLLVPILHLGNQYKKLYYIANNISPYEYGQKISDGKLDYYEKDILDKFFLKVRAKNAHKLKKDILDYVDFYLDIITDSTDPDKRIAIATKSGAIMTVDIILKFAIERKIRRTKISFNSTKNELKAYIHNVIQFVLFIKAEDLDLYNDADEVFKY